MNSFHCHFVALHIHLLLLELYVDICFVFLMGPGHFRVPGELVGCILTHTPILRVLLLVLILLSLQQSVVEIIVVVIIESALRLPKLLAFFLGGGAVTVAAKSAIFA